VAGGGAYSSTGSGGVEGQTTVRIVEGTFFGKEFDDGYAYVANDARR
jgi:hypothetical protein